MFTVHHLWPGGNDTAIVEGNIDPARYRTIAAAIIQAHPIIEQVGFLQKPENPIADVRLQMTGGEFCGNATRSAAYFWSQKMSKGTVIIETSGLEQLVPARCTATNCSIVLPDTLVQNLVPVSGGVLVNMKGISHMILNGETPTTEDIHEAITPYKHLPAVGAIYTQQDMHGAVIDPYVFFVQGDKPVLVNESACASGSIAAARVLREKHGNGPIAIAQPTGEVFRISFVKEGIHVDAAVHYRGTLALHPDKVVASGRLMPVAG